MTESSIISILIHISEGPDALCVIPDPDSEFIISFCIFHRSYRHRNAFSLTFYLECHCISIQLFDIMNQIFFCGNFFTVKSHNIISLFHNIFRRFLRLSILVLNLSCIDHKNALCLHINPDRASADIDFLLIHRRYFHLFKRNTSQQSARQRITSILRNCHCLFKGNQRILQHFCHICLIFSRHLNLIRYFPAQILISQKYDCQQIQCQKTYNKKSVFFSSVHFPASFLKNKRAQSPVRLSSLSMRSNILFESCIFLFLCQFFHFFGVLENRRCDFRATQQSCQFPDGIIFRKYMNLGDCICSS